MSLTIVTGFINLAAFDPETQLRAKNFDHYLDRAHAILCLDIPKVFFVESEHIPIIQQKIAYNPDNTLVIPFERHEQWLWPHREQLLTLPLPPNANPTKDTHDFLITMHQKARWTARVANENPFNTDHFMWIDFGIEDILPCTLAVAMTHCMAHLDHLHLGKIRIPGCWNIAMIHQYISSRPSQLTWFYCGGMYAGDKLAMQLFDQIQTQVTLALMAAGLFSWEVTTWAHMTAHSPALFDWYSADHNPSMFLNF